MPTPNTGQRSASEFVFFNHAAVAPISSAAAQRLRRYSEQAEPQGNAGSDWYSEIERLRRRAAELIGAGGGHEIAFVPTPSSRWVFCR